ncbi:HSF [Hepatospora eriocheir]|uniref:HSF n=1 Tax=Hepatospora eriocheir TaxID=1081669 RepID=A0A1X0QK50_9MICR|nr:HSF [Hepatospora eriocheir]
MTEIKHESEEENSAQKVPMFIKKLWKEITDITNKYINFDSTGEKVVIYDKENFIKHSMHLITNAKDYRSFIRSLNMYGFCKVSEIKTSPNTDIFFHQFFRLHEPEKLKLIFRDTNSVNKKSLPVIINNLQVLNEENQHLQSKIFKLENRIKKIELQNKSLLEIVATAFRKGLTEQYQDNLLHNQIQQPKDQLSIISNNNRNLKILGNEVDDVTSDIEESVKDELLQDEFLYF